MDQSSGSEPPHPPDVTDALDTTPITRQELLAAQMALCLKHDWPHFAPSTGVCWACSRDIVTPRWAVDHITGCIRCHRSFTE